MRLIPTLIVSVLAFCLYGFLAHKFMVIEDEVVDQTGVVHSVYGCDQGKCLVGVISSRGDSQTWRTENRVPEGSTLSRSCVYRKKMLSCGIAKEI